MIMKKHAKRFYGFMILLLFILAGCASKPSITEFWMDETFEVQPYGKILIIGAAEKITFRNLFEAELVKQLQSMGIDAVPSYEILPYNNMLTRELVISAVEKSGIDSVLITSLVDRKKKTVYYSLNGSNPYGYYTGLYTAMGGVGRVDSYEIPILYLKTNLYDARSEKMIWSITSESEYKYNIKSINSAITLIINKLREDGLI
jgi:hypothetical protein